MAARAQLNSLEPRRICLIKPSALGDIVQTLPVLAMLRDRFPAAHIAWVVKAPLAEILQGHPQLDEVIPLPYPQGTWPKLIGLRRLMRALRQRRFDLAIDLQGLARSGLLTWGTRAERRVGSSLSREFSHWAYTDRVDVGPWEQPALETYLPIARALGCEGPPPLAVVPRDASAERWAAKQLGGLPRPLVAIHPGAQWETKRWPPGSFAALAQLARRQFGAGIVVVGGPGEQELGQQVQQQVEIKTQTVVNLAGQTSLPQLAAICRAADVFVAGDTGPMHLAAAMGTPVVGVFTCTDPLRSGPRRDTPVSHRCVATDVDCAASYLTKCRKLTCMAELSPARVWPALEQVLRGILDTKQPRHAG